MRGTPAAQLDPMPFRQAPRPAQDVLDEHVTDQDLKAVLSASGTYAGRPRPGWSSRIRR
ncbi:hypothetical protein [Streptomyces globisporus]|uniref:hypothetical protein n=1 Tax=Streptomyces globisporus TaxID=1908 RepID=UPI000A448E38|nr:hypothetical protein [Streptomyces globisporus]